MPSSKYTRPPGPFTTAAEPHFQFDPDQWVALRRLLPEKFRELSAPPELASDNMSIADAIVQLTAEQIGVYYSGTKKMERGRALTPASEAAAIRQLRNALRPFKEGWVTTETANLIPDELHALLAAREAALKSLPASPAKQQPLLLLCSTVGVCLKKFAEANNIELKQPQALRFVSEALNFASIEHPAPESHSGGLTKLVFPPSR
jgi:hypothetical protein